MATSAMPSSVFAFVCFCVGLLQMPSPSDVDQVLVASCPPGAESTTLTDIHDASSLSSAASSSDGDRNDVVGHAVPTFSMVRLGAGFVRLYQLVTALVVQVTVVASDVVSLKDRITAVESTHAPALVPDGQETEALARQVNELCERVASQGDRIAGLEHSRRAETESYKRTIQELTTKVDEMKVSDDRKTQSFKNFQQSMECQAARITGVKADTARKIALLQSEMGGVRAELAAVKEVAVPVNASSASQAAKEARRARILASVAQRMEDAELAEGILPSFV